MRRAAEKKASRGVPAKKGKTSKEASSDKPKHGYHPTFAIASAYTGTFCVYLLGNLAPSLPELPYPWSKSLLPSNETIGNNSWSTTTQIILALMFTFHFCRRTVETVFTHKYVRTYSLLELVGAHIYYWGFAFWMGLAIREDLGYISTQMPLFIGGVILFWVGETGNCAVHLQLRDLRTGKLTNISAPSSRVLPRGWLFSFVSCPHYSFELLTWTGFTLASMVLASFGFLAASLVVLLGLSMQHHQRYQKDFDGKGGRELYPSNRKALIPFIY